MAGGFSYYGFMLLRLRLHPNLIALAIYVALATAVTWPFAIHPLTTLTAPIGGDISSSVAKFGSVALQHSNPFANSHLDYLSYPDGVEGNLGVDRVSFFSTLWLWLASLLINPITAHSLLTYTGYFLTAFITYLFIRQVTKSPQAGFIAGLVYGFWPHMYALARADCTYTQMWLFLLPPWAAYRFIKQQSWQRLTLLALSIVPAVFWTPYYAFHVLIVAGSCGLVLMGWLLMKRHFIWAIIVVVTLMIGWGGVIGVYWVVGHSAPAASIPVRSIDEIYQQSAHPLMYVLPGAFTGWGAFLTQKLVKHVTRAAGANLYIGLSVIVLIFTGSLVAIWRRYVSRSDKRLPVYTPLALMAAFAAVACLLFSLPPTLVIHHVTIATPNWLVAHFVPALRAGQRFVMPLMGMVAILAGLSAHLVLQRLPSRTRILLVTALSLIIWADLWTPFPNRTATIAISPALKVLSHQVPHPAAAFHDSSLVTSPAAEFCIYQIQHRLRLVNDCGFGRSNEYKNTLPPRLEYLTNLPACDQLETLKVLGIGYVITDRAEHKIFGCGSDRRYTLQMVSSDTKFIVYSIR